MTALVTTRIYSPTTGLVTNSQSDMITFGTVAPGGKSEIIIVDAHISGVITAGDLGIGIANSNLPSGSLPGVLLYSVLDSLETVTEPILLFPGIAGYSGLSNVIDVGFRTPLVSKYVALMVQAADKPVECGCFILKWFFGFDLPKEIANAQQNPCP